MHDPEVRQAERLAAAYLDLVDDLLPGRVEGFYVVGSAALGAFDADHSDVDFIAVLDRPLGRDEVRKLRVAHRRSAGVSVLRNVARGRLAIPETCNGAYVCLDDLTRPVSKIVPVASHTGVKFFSGQGFDVNPVMWQVLATRGVALRGPAPDTLGLDTEPELLRSWNLANLESYWRSWAESGLRSRRLQPALQSTRWAVAWGVLGAPRLHRTIASGDIISKEQAGAYALATFGARWHPIIEEGLAFRRSQPVVAAAGNASLRRRRAAEFVLEVVRSAADL